MLHGPSLLIRSEQTLFTFPTSSSAAEDKKIMSESVTSPNYIELCADIVSAYVSNNSVPTADLPSLLTSVYAALTKSAQGLGRVKTLRQKSKCDFPHFKALHHHRRAHSG